MTTKSSSLVSRREDGNNGVYYPEVFFTLALTINPDVQTVHPLCIRIYFGAETLTVFITSFIEPYPWSYTSLGTW